MRWAPTLFLPAPIQASLFRRTPSSKPADWASATEFADVRLTPHYPAKAPLEDVLRQVVPGTDAFITEKYAYEIMPLLRDWGHALKKAPPAVSILGTFVDASIHATPLVPANQITVRSDHVIEVVRRKFTAGTVSSRDQFLQEMTAYLAPLGQVETAEFEITGIEEIAGPSPAAHLEIRYTFVGNRTDATREQRIGQWLTQWSRDPSNGWRVLAWNATEETLSRSHGPIFKDITAAALGRNESYQQQMLRGVDEWRTVLDGACGIDVYGNNGLALGDSNNNGLDDIYVCQPAGLPNRFYRNRGDGTFEDVTKEAGVDVLDATACALFADFENKGSQDLLVVGSAGPLLFLNQGNGKFALKRDAFKFAQPPQGAFTHAAVADYDRDGRLDIYFCLYSYYLGLDQYHYPAPYFDARNGPPNFLLHNEGNANFRDETVSTGLNAENDRYSFACSWGDSNGDGWPDLYVANDFGRSNLYRNKGDGTFTAVSAEAGVQDTGAGMSACWADFDGHGNQDIYVANMWSAAGIRVSAQKPFHDKDPEDIRGLYRQHARGNSLYRNMGDGRFENVSIAAGVEMGRWAWCSDVWDFDHDGYADLYIANGYVSGPETQDLASFFWRQVVASSPATQASSLRYEQGWGAINELIRADASWSGYERNVFYINNRDGTFSDISGAVVLDFPEDSRSFALADLDSDGRLEVVLKNRNAPQLRILRNAMKEIGNSIAFRLHGMKSNRDAIGAAVTVETPHRQTRYVQAGSGFLSQHSKELFFGLGNEQGPVHANIRWPSGLTQNVANLPVNHRIEIVEGLESFVAKPFPSPPSYISPPYPPPPQPEKLQAPSSLVETWLIEPLSAPQFSLPDITGKSWNLSSFRGSFVLLNFWSMASASAREQLQQLAQFSSMLIYSGLKTVAVSADDPGNQPLAQSFAGTEAFPFLTLFATPDVLGVYNIVYRFLFDRRRNLGVPTSFLIDKEGMIVKVYQGSVSPDRLLSDMRSPPGTAEDRIRKALPFEGTLWQSEFQRNDFTYGVAFFQHGYLDQAAESFQQVIAAKPNYAEAYYNLGTLYLRKNAFQDARRYLEQTVKLRQNYPEAWNNLGMLAAQQGNYDEAIRNFQHSLLLRPDYAIALVNLGNIYRRQRSFDEGEKLLRRAIELQPDDPEANYNLGMLYAQQNQVPQASEYLERAVSLRPDYPDALNNLGVLFVREQRYPEAEERFKTCIQAAPNFDQAYLNLARLYAIMDEKPKARVVLQDLLRRQPQHKMAQHALEMLN